MGQKNPCAVYPKKARYTFPLLFPVLPLLCFTLFSIHPVNAQNPEARRKQYLDDILKINIPQRFQQNTRRVSAKDSTWMDWLQRTGELPPDFSTMPSIPFLPDPLLTLKDGKEQPITTKEAWAKKREWIKAQYQYWVSGTTPPAPKNLNVNVLSKSEENGVTIELIELSFGPNNAARLTLELMIPKGTGPFPVYMTQWNHRGWAQLAVRRGYMACVYAAADIKDDTETYLTLYPEYDWSLLMRRAWAASRALDYLLTRKETHPKQIAITGHSRNGKQSVLAAAFDERFTAVISSSSGTGGDAPWRYGDPQYASETLDIVTAFNGHWFHPRLRFFFGREDKLPIDQNSLLALVAPRKLLLHYSIVEHGINPWANEQCYQSVKKVYDFLGSSSSVGVFTRMGEHAVAARDLERCIDFLDIQFKRSRGAWENDLYHDYSFPAWAKNHPGDSVKTLKLKPVHLKTSYANVPEFIAHKKDIQNNLQWLLGEAPSNVKAQRVKGTSPSAPIDWINMITGQPKVAQSKALAIGSYQALGDYVNAMLYYPTDEQGKIKSRPNGKVPVVVYLHQYAHGTGIAIGYNKNGWPHGNDQLFKALLDKGFAVLAYDMMGFGTRQEEGKYFYDRFPQWSKMGNLVHDVKACVDALASFEDIDSNHIYLLGNTLGGSVGLMAAAEDERIAGLAVLSAFSPWRTSNASYESLRTYSHLHGLIPRLGWYAHQPQKVPLDVDEIMACIAPRPLLFIAPDMDRYTDFNAVKKSMEAARKVYALFQKEEQLQLQSPHEINRMTEPMYAEIATYFAKLLER